MSEAFKNLINDTVVRQVSHHIKRVWSPFNVAAFEELALDGLDELEFKARAHHLCTALEACLPDRFDKAARILIASLKPAPALTFHDDPDQELGTLQTDKSGLAGWPLWGFGEFVVRQGMQQPELALDTLREITQRFTAEFAVRPFIVEHAPVVWRKFDQWVNDPSAHVRRWVSEGSRPRLPWGIRLMDLVSDPSPTMNYLRALQDDPSEYVRRSVANHLNDIGKDHPERLVEWLQTSLPSAPATRVRLLRHASRSLIKSGHPGILAAWGLDRPFKGEITLSLDSSHVRLGQSLGVAVRLRSTSKQSQSLEMDYRVHHVKANGERSPKIFKGKRIQLLPGETITWNKSHSLKPVTTRQYYPGEHEVDIQINGQVLCRAVFDLSL